MLHIVNCKDCQNYSDGEQSDGILWQKCDEDWECSNRYESKYKAKINNSEIKVKIDAEPRIIHIDFKMD